MAHCYLVVCLHTSWVSLELSSLCKSSASQSTNRSSPLSKEILMCNLAMACPTCLASFSSALAPLVCILHSKKTQKYEPRITKNNMQRKSNITKKNNCSGKAWQDRAREVVKLGEPVRTFSVGSHVERKMKTAELPPWQPDTNTLTPRTILWWDRKSLIAQLVFLMKQYLLELKELKFLSAFIDLGEKKNPSQEEDFWIQLLFYHYHHYMKLQMNFADRSKAQQKRQRGLWKTAKHHERGGTESLLLAVSENRHGKELPETMWRTLMLAEERRTSIIS